MQRLRTLLCTVIWVTMCISCSTREYDRTPLEVSPDYGKFLERLPSLKHLPNQPLQRRQPLVSEGFVADYHRVTMNETATLHGSFYGTSAKKMRFEFACDPGRDEAVLFNVHAGQSGIRIESRVGARRIALDSASGVSQYRVPTSSTDCVDGRVEIEITGAEGVLIGQPVLGVAAPKTRFPIVVISIDTLRADYFEERAEQPLAALLGDSRQYTRAFSSYPTTPIAHSVLLSGLPPTFVVKEPLTTSTSVIEAARKAGYATLGFVAGGLMRARFGFGGRPPGFALGFDVYIEDLHLTMRERDAQAKEAVESGEVVTHTLAPALARSLAWFRDHPGEPALHFLHGYDVHEYREVARRYFDQEVAARSQHEETSRCIAESATNVGSELVIHNGPTQGPGSPPGTQESLACEKIILSVMYGARVRSVVEMLRRYFEALDALGLYEDAMIVVTGDHGESLLDEAFYGQKPALGHNRLLYNNYHVPLWVKQPRRRHAGERDDEVVGLVEVRSMIEHAIADDDSSAVMPVSTRSVPVSSSKDGVGAVINVGALCATPPRSNELFVFAAGQWSDFAGCASHAQLPYCSLQEVCREQVAAVGMRPLDDFLRAPKSLRSELRALGYVQ